MLDGGFQRANFDELAKPGGQVTCGDLKALTTLSGRGRNIESLAGVQFAEKLSSLDLGGNQLRDVSPLERLGRLTTVTLERNFIADLEPLVRTWYWRAALRSRHPASGSRVS